MSEALRSWHCLVEEINGRTAFGMPAVRDPDATCDAYEPTASADLVGLTVTAPGDGACCSDGHYLCVGCLHLSGEAIAERVAAGRKGGA